MDMDTNTNTEMEWNTPFLFYFSIFYLARELPVAFEIPIPYVFGLNEMRLSYLQSGAGAGAGNFVANQ
jgi:hypothetical protein